MDAETRAMFKRLNDRIDALEKLVKVPELLPYSHPVSRADRLRRSLERRAAKMLKYITENQGCSATALNGFMGGATVRKGLDQLAEILKEKGKPVHRLKNTSETGGKKGHAWYTEAHLKKTGKWPIPPEMEL